MKDGTAEFKIKDMKTHHICGEIVALVTPPQITNICSYVMDKR